MKKRKRLAVTAAACAVVIVVAAATLGAAWSAGTEAAGEAEPDSRALVEVRTPVIGDLVVRGEFIGTVDPQDQVTVYPKASGEVLEVFFNVGDTVEAGDVLAKIDSRVLEQTIAQTQAAVTAAQSKAQLNLEIAEKSLETTQYNLDEGYDSALIQAEAAVESAKTNLRGRQHTVSTIRDEIRDLREDKKQVPDGAVYDDYIEAKQKELIQAEVAMESAEVALAQAEDTLRAVRQQKEDQKDSSLDSIEMARLGTDFSDQYIAIQKLQDDLKNYTVTATIGGVVEQRSVDPYDMASPQAPMFVISNKDAMTVQFGVSESSLEHLKVGDTVTVEKNAVTATGSISEISTMVDARSGLYAVKATVPDASFPIHSGSTIKIYADTKKAENSLLIPIDALYYEGGKPYVYLAADGVARKAFVETGISDEELIQIVSGLQTGDRIITTWSSSLADGAGIVLAGEEETPAPGTVLPSESGETSSRPEETSPSEEE